LAEWGAGVREHHSWHVSSIEKKAREWNLRTVIGLEQQVMSLQSKIRGTSGFGSLVNSGEQVNLLRPLSSKILDTDAIN
jgi:hypothetical protein